jgi:hypothetical protein
MFAMTPRERIDIWRTDVDKDIASWFTKNISLPRCLDMLAAWNTWVYWQFYVAIYTIYFRLQTRHFQCLYFECLHYQKLLQPFTRQVIPVMQTACH